MFIKLFFRFGIGDSFVKPVSNTGFTEVIILLLRGIQDALLRGIQDALLRGIQDVTSTIKLKCFKRSEGILFVVKLLTINFPA